MVLRQVAQGLANTQSEHSSNFAPTHAHTQFQLSFSSALVAARSEALLPSSASPTQWSGFVESG